MDISMNVNGQSKVPPGFRFHPTEEELLHYYLRKKVAYEKIDLDVIREVDLNKLEPWDIQDKCSIGSTPQNDWYFFSHKDKKYPTGTRTNRATAAGFWKATGRDKIVHSSFRRIGMRKTLVFYKGRAPHGQKSDWIMHEYRLDDNNIPTQDSSVSNMCDCAHEEGWVVCRVFKKKNYHKSLESTHRSLPPSMDTRAQLQALNKDGVLEQLLAFMDSRSCKQEIDNFTTNHNAMQQFVNPMFVHLPRLDSSTQLTTSPPASSATFDQLGSSLKTYNSMSNLLAEEEHPRNTDTNMVDDHECISSWADLDKFVASQLNGQMEESKNMYSCYGSESSEKLGFSADYDEQDLSARRNVEEACISELDIWSLAQQASLDPLRHLSG
ncbi:hypothetical protein L2E82_40379 [Cichorium intybus]|uniref:Uncharacterized protein n=1 Tax=Cichorium intybus TaxID=13427 RepID=A0ACB9ALS6_CICIN|nr:hypothetical protein L2E82_40379 [Cichorium intybus]